VIAHAGHQFAAALPLLGKDYKGLRSVGIESRELAVLHPTDYGSRDGSSIVGNK